jgi:hypothetical protein
MPASTTTVTRISVLDIMFGGAEHEDKPVYLERSFLEPSPSPKTFTLDLDDREIIRQILWKLRRHEEELLATGLTNQQKRLVSRLRGTRMELWLAVPGIHLDE